MPTMSDILDSGELEGYRPGAPPYRPSVDLFDSAQIDFEVCEESCCSECRHQGLTFHPFVTQGSYRAFAECPACGYTEEF